MAVKCGRGPHYHESVTDVRACYNGEQPPTVDVPNATNRQDAPTEKQVKFANTLLEQLGRPTRNEAEWIARGQTRRSISELINDLQIDVAFARERGELVKDTPRASSHFKAVDYPTAAEGNYAVTSLTGNNDLDFFKIDRPTEGRWNGFLFVKRIIGGHDPERVAKATAEGWLALIAAPSTANAAMVKFGQEMGQCGRCGRTLTDEESRVRGIGPDCAAKMGM